MSAVMASTPNAGAQPHSHLAVTDGLFVRGHDRSLTFHPARRLDAETARNLAPIVQRRSFGCTSDGDY